MEVIFRSGIDHNQPGTEWLWPGRIVANTINLIDGRKGSGKSTVVSSILGAWRLGRMPDGTSPHSDLRRVLWMSSEEDYDSVIAPRLSSQGISPKDVLTLDRRTMLRANRINLEEHSKHILDTIRSQRIDAVILDPWTEFKPNYFSTKDDGAVRDYLSHMIQIASVTKTTWIMMRHLNKSKSAFRLDEGSGSVQIAACCRSVLRCDRPIAEKPDRYLSVVACNLGNPVLPMHYHITADKKGLPLVKWFGESGMTLDEIAELNTDPEGRDVLSDAIMLINQCMDENKHDAAQILKECDDAGIGRTTLRKAKTQLKIISRRSVNEMNGKACWRWLRSGVDTLANPK